MTLELMNETPDPRPAVLTIEYEYIPSMPSGFSAMEPWWLDVSGPCGDSDMLVPTNETAFNFSSTGWKAPYSGSIVLMGGHLHDGGELLEVTQNGKSICDFKPTYGATPGYIDMIPMNMSSMPNIPAGMSMSMTHISNITTCTNVGNFNSGDSFGIQADYNITDHAPMLGSNGTIEPVMGISILYVKTENSSSSSGSPSQSGPSPSSIAHSGLNQQFGLSGSSFGFLSLMAVIAGGLI
jgi:hypothetical protein